MYSRSLAVSSRSASESSARCRAGTDVLGVEVIWELVLLVDFTAAMETVLGVGWSARVGRVRVVGWHERVVLRVGLGDHEGTSSSQIHEFFYFRPLQLAYV